MLMTPQLPNSPQSTGVSAGESDAYINYAEDLAWWKCHHCGHLYEATLTQQLTTTSATLCPQHQHSSATVA